MSVLIVFMVLMARKSCVIPTCLAIASLMLLLAFGGLNTESGCHEAAHSHSHSHAQNHVGGTHTHTHNHAEHGCGVANWDASDLSISETATLLDPHACCCHCDHSHATPVYVLTDSGLRGQGQLPLVPCPLPDLWQPMSAMSTPESSLPPPPRLLPSDSLSQLRTVVLLT